MGKPLFTTTHQAQTSRARTGQLHTSHGVVHTPAFVPVGTQGSVKSMTPQDLTFLGTELFFVNTYHMYLRPGVSVIKSFGGLHKFIGWKGPLITDSGGFQIFSLGQKNARSLVDIDASGVTFRSHWDGSSHRFTPEKSIEIQHDLDADIILAFDDCTPYPATHTQAAVSLERTHAWATRSWQMHQKLKKNNKSTQMIYGVVQGSVFASLRRKSARYIAGLGFDGIAIGGVSVGESKRQMQAVLEWVVPVLPEHTPRHLLGVGDIDDIFAAVEAGVDSFDCVQPTRLARMGHLYKFKAQSSNVKASRSTLQQFTLDITKQNHAKDTRPIDVACGCYTCQHFSRAYLHHLFRVRELLAYRLATLHNLWVVHTLVAQIRHHIRTGGLADLKRAWIGA